MLGGLLYLVAVAVDRLLALGVPVVGARFRLGLVLRGDVLGRGHLVGLPVGVHHTTQARVSSSGRRVEVSQYGVWSRGSVISSFTTASTQPRRFM